MRASQPSSCFILRVFTYDFQDPLKLQKDRTPSGHCGRICCSVSIICITKKRITFKKTTIVSDNSTLSCIYKENCIKSCLSCAEQLSSYLFSPFLFIVVIKQLNETKSTTQETLSPPRLQIPSRPWQMSHGTCRSHPLSYHFAPPGRDSPITPVVSTSRRSPNEPPGVVLGGGTRKGDNGAATASLYMVLQCVFNIGGKFDSNSVDTGAASGNSEFRLHFVGTVIGATNSPEKGLLIWLNLNVCRSQEGFSRAKKLSLVF